MTPQRIVELLRAIPDEHRDYVTSDAQAQVVHGLSGATVDELVALGLPCREHAGERLFDDHDLANAALHLGTRSIQARAMASWATTLDLVSARRTPIYRVRYLPECPHGHDGHHGTCHYQVVLPGGDEVEGEQTGPRFPVADVVVETSSSWPALPPAAAAVAAAHEGLHFFALPPALRRDAAFTRATGLAGCAIASEIMATDCRAAGLEARTRYGILLATPFSTTHMWTEIRLAGRWVPFDPHLLRTLVRHAGLSPEEWPPTRSPGAILSPVAVTYRPLVVHASNSPADVTLRTDVLEGDDT